MLNDVDMVELTVYLEVAADIYLTWQSRISWLQNDFGILKWNNSYSFQPFMEVDSWPGPLGQKLFLLRQLPEKSLHFEADREHWSSFGLKMLKLAFTFRGWRSEDDSGSTYETGECRRVCGIISDCRIAFVPFEVIYTSFLSSCVRWFFSVRIIITTPSWWLSPQWLTSSVIIYIKSQTFLYHCLTSASVVVELE